MHRWILWWSVATLAVVLTACGVARNTNGAAGQDDTSRGDDSGSDLTNSDTCAHYCGTTDNRADGRGDIEEPDWNSVEYTSISLGGDSIMVDGPGATASGSTVTIIAAGIYRISGTLDDGQILVNTADQDDVELYLEGIDVTCTTSSPLYVIEAEYVSVVLSAGTRNTLTDGSSYVFADPTVNEPNAALFSKADLEITGTGALTVNGNYNDGIASKDSLHIEDGTIVVTAVDDGIRGKDEVVIEGGDITVTTSNGDGFSSDNAEDTTKGFVAIERGTINIIAGSDGIAAETCVCVTGGNITISSGGGSIRTVAETESAKGIKGVAGVTINAGIFDIDAADDGLHSNGDIFINGGMFAIASADDGMHSDSNLTVNDGEIHVTKSFEGLDAMVITINGGTLNLAASDDGINVAGGADGSGGAGPAGPGGGSWGGDTSLYFVYIFGGYIAINADGDGIDSNGSIEISDGVILINGPTQDMNGPVDIGDGGGAYFKITGGFLVAVGSSGMAIAPDTVSSQYSVLINFTSRQAGQLFHLQSSTGDPLLTYAPLKTYQSVLFSAPSLVPGAYEVYLGGSSTGTLADSLYDGGMYAAGTRYTSFAISSITTRVGSTGGHGPGW